VPRAGQQSKDGLWEPSYAAPKSTLDQFLAFGTRLNRTKVDFLKIDVETALTFAGIAMQAEDRVKKARNRQSARKAYDTVVRLMDRVDLSDEDAQLLARKLKRLRSELATLGEVF